MKQLIPFLLAYFIWDFVSALLKVEGPFELVHWLMLAMTVAFAVLLFFTGREAIADSKRRKAEREEELEKERQAQAARRRAMYIDDFEDSEPVAEATVEDGSAQALLQTSAKTGSAQANGQDAAEDEANPEEVK